VTVAIIDIIDGLQTTSLQYRKVTIAGFAGMMELREIENGATTRHAFHQIRMSVVDRHDNRHPAYRGLFTEFQSERLSVKEFALGIGENTQGEKEKGSVVVSCTATGVAYPLIKAGFFLGGRLGFDNYSRKPANVQARLSIKSPFLSQNRALSTRLSGGLNYR
jgi:hypothetical protein